MTVIVGRGAMRAPVTSAITSAKAAMKKHMAIISAVSAPSRAGFNKA
jgi:hypothetical protein